MDSFLYWLAIRQKLSSKPILSACEYHRFAKPFCIPCFIINSPAITSQISDHETTRLNSGNDFICYIVVMLVVIYAKSLETTTLFGFDCWLDRIIENILHFRRKPHSYKCGIRYIGLIDEFLSKKHSFVSEL